MDNGQIDGANGWTKFCPEFFLLQFPRSPPPPVLPYTPSKWTPKQTVLGNGRTDGGQTMVREIFSSPTPFKWAFSIFHSNLSIFSYFPDRVFPITIVAGQILSLPVCGRVITCSLVLWWWHCSTKPTPCLTLPRFRFAISLYAAMGDFGWPFHLNVGRINLQKYLTTTYPALSPVILLNVLFGANRDRAKFRT